LRFFPTSATETQVGFKQGKYFRSHSQSGFELQKRRRARSWTSTLKLASRETFRCSLREPVNSARQFLSRSFSPGDRRLSLLSGRLCLRTLFREAIGMVEAKPAGQSLTSVEEQSAKYVAGVSAGLPHWHNPLTPGRIMIRNWRRDYELLIWLKIQVRANVQ
jgi:hypothetical protein